MQRQHSDISIVTPADSGYGDEVPTPKSATWDTGKFEEILPVPVGDVPMERDFSFESTGYMPMDFMPCQNFLASPIPAPQEQLSVQMPEQCDAQQYCYDLAPDPSSWFDIKYGADEQMLEETGRWLSQYTTGIKMQF